MACPAQCHPRRPRLRRHRYDGSIMRTDSTSERSPYGGVVNRELQRPSGRLEWRRRSTPRPAIEEKPEKRKHSHQVGVHLGNPGIMVIWCRGYKHFGGCRYSRRDRLLHHRRHGAARFRHGHATGQTLRASAGRSVPSAATLAMVSRFCSGVRAAASAGDRRSGR